MTDHLIQRSLPVSDVRVDEGGRHVTVRLLTYGREYHVSDDGASTYVERWRPAAFRRSFGPPHWQDVPLTYEHDALFATRALPVGVATRGWEEGDSVLLSGSVSRTSMGDDLLTLLRDGVIRGVSIEARTFGQTPLVGGVEYHQGQLRRVAFTTLPQYDDAELVALRSEPPASFPRRAELQQRLDALSASAG
jgi:phage head maturation protease